MDEELSKAFESYLKNTWRFPQVRLGYAYYQNIKTGEITQRPVSWFARPDDSDFNDTEDENEDEDNILIFLDQGEISN